MPRGGPAHGTSLGVLDEAFEILGELGRGGTAVVYHGRDRELGRDVAIKVIRSTYVEDEEAVARLEREARTVAGLQHPNIVMLYGTQRLDDRSLALVMQYVPGRTLKDVVREEGALSFSRAGRILTDVAAGLAYAHRRRIVHRDIKPENIYLDDETGIARLSDFGIARPWDSDSNLTLPGMALGTPAYMSPEQIDGEDLDGRSDLYSLGMVAYEVLTGRQPWAGENLYSIIYRQKHETLPSLREIRPDIPPHLQDAIEVALKKDPDERWAGAEEFAERVSAGPLPDTPAPADLHFPERPGGLEVSPSAETIFYRRDGDEAVGDAGPPAAAGAAAAAAGTAPGTDATREDASSTVKEAEEPSEAEAAATDGAPEAGVGAGEPPAAGAPASEEDPVARALRGGSFSPFREGRRRPPVREEPAERHVPGEEEPEEEPDVAPPMVPDEDRDPEEVRRRRRSGIVPALLAGAVVVAALLGLLTWMTPGDEGGAGGDLDVPAPAVDATGAGPGTAEDAPPGDLAGGAASGPGAGEDAGPAAAVLEGRSGSGQVTEAGGTLADPLEVFVTDAQGRPVEEASVRFDVTYGDGTVEPAVTTTDAEGIARARWRLGPRPGEQRVVARVEGLPGAGALFEAEAEVGAPAALSVVDGGGQTAEAGATVPEPVVVRVLDAVGNPIAGAPVQFVASGGGSVSSASVLTNEQGLATTRWTLGSGDNVLLASVPGISRPPVEIRAGTAAPAPPDLGPRPAVSAGGTHSCGVGSDGLLYCWGGNDSGQLGDGTASRRSVPAPVGGGRSFARVFTGISHSCALDEEGRAWCWGANESGQLGDGTTTRRTDPVPVAGDVRFVTLRAGVSHTCGLTGGGTAWCWGGNANGQLGDGTRSGRATPGQVAGNRSYRALAAGWGHTCAISTDGDPWCWGRNAFGQLGDGSGGDRTTPAQANATGPFVDIAAGSAHSCAVRADGQAFCWGQNSYGQLGDGTTENRSTPTPVSGTGRFDEVVAGGVHSCGLTAAGNAYCWGRNNYGQLGDASTQDRLRPAAVQGGMRFSELQAAGAHTCGLSGGQPFCWGYNLNGQLGDGSRTNRTTPTVVSRLP